MRLKNKWLSLYNRVRQIEDNRVNVLELYNWNLVLRSDASPSHLQV